MKTDKFNNLFFDIFFFFNDTATTEIYTTRHTLSLHDALPIYLWIMAAGLVGAALFYGDGVITPAISVLSAVEGLKVATPLFEPYIIPISLVLLTALFIVQRRGTAAIGGLFGPIMVVWFAVLAVLGIWSIGRQPHILLAVNPYYGLA